MGCDRRFFLRHAHGRRAIGGVSGDRGPWECKVRKGLACLDVGGTFRVLGGRCARLRGRAAGGGQGGHLRLVHFRHGLRAGNGRTTGVHRGSAARAGSRGLMSLDISQGGNMLEGKKVVLAYSGGLDTSVCVKWLEQQGAIPYALYLGRGQGGPAGDVRAKALQIGAADTFVRDARAEFVDEYVAPAIRAKGLYGGTERSSSA